MSSRTPLMMCNAVSDGLWNPDLKQTPLQTCTHEHAHASHTHTHTHTHTHAHVHSSALSPSPSLSLLSPQYTALHSSYASLPSSCSFARACVRGAQAHMLTRVSAFSPSHTRTGKLCPLVDTTDQPMEDT